MRGCGAGELSEDEMLDFAKSIPLLDKIMEKTTEEKKTNKQVDDDDDCTSPPFKCYSLIDVIASLSFPTVQGDSLYEETNIKDEETLAIAFRSLTAEEFKMLLKKFLVAQLSKNGSLAS